jgi:hypothetical protein
MEKIGQLFDVGICGAGDHHFACCMIGQGDKSVPKSISSDYRMHVLQFEKRCQELHRSMGYVHGTIHHYWHGKKQDRKYNDRWKILERAHYQPSKDIIRNWQGLISIHPSKHQLRHDLLQYFHTRNEDSIDL